MLTDEILERARKYWFDECRSGREVPAMDVGDLAAFAREEIARELEAQCMRIDDTMDGYMGQQVMSVLDQIVSHCHERITELRGRE